MPAKGCATNRKRANGWICKAEPEWIWVQPGCGRPRKNEIPGQHIRPGTRNWANAAAEPADPAKTKDCGNGRTTNQKDRA